MALRALAADPNEPLAHFVRAHALFNGNRMSDAIVEAQRSLDLNPSFISSYNLLCSAHNFLGRPEEGMKYCDKGIRLSPRDPVALYFLYIGKGAALQFTGQYEQSAEWLRRAIAHAPQIPLPYLVLAASLALSDHEIEAREMFKRSLALGSKLDSIAAVKSYWSHSWNSNDPVSVTAREQISKGLRKIGMPEE